MKKLKDGMRVKMVCSLFLGLGLIAGLFWAVTPHSAAEAQDVDFNFVVDPLNTAPAELIDAFVPSLPRDEGQSSNEQLDTSFVEPHSSLAASAPTSPSPRDEKPPDFTSFAPTYPYGPRTDSGAPLFTSPGNVLNTRSRSDLATPPLPGSTDLAVCMTSDRVWGVVGAGDTATVTVDGTQMGAAAADGNGFFWTTLYEGNGDRPELSGGEPVVIYSDGAQKANITLHTITGTIDVVSDVVSGTIGDVSTPISVTVYAPWGEPSMTSYSQTVSTDGSGNFTADFTGLWDFVVWDEATAAYVESGVEVHRHIYPEDSLLVRPAPWNRAMGRAAPGTIVTATLYFSDTTEKDSDTFTADATDGLYNWSVPTDVLESDIVAVEFEDGMVMSRTIDTFTIDDVEVANDRIVGQAEPNAIVRGLVSDLTPQGWRDVTMSTTADATGVYTLDFGSIADLMPGHWNAVFVADAEGDDLNLWHRAPSVEVNQTWNDISGVGPSDPGQDSDGRVVTLTLDSTTTHYTTEMDWYSGYRFSQDDGLPDIGPGEIVTVEAEGYAWQGVVEVMTMTAQHDTGADQFTGEVETPTDRVELWGTQWEDFGVQWLYPVGGQFDTLVTVSSPFTATPAGFDVRNGVGYEVRHRTADDYLERIYREVDYLRVYPQYNGVMALFAPAGTPYTITLRDSGGGFKAQLTGTSNDPLGEAGWNHFGGTGEQIETGDQLQAQSAAGFSQTVHIPAMDLQLDEVNDRVSGSAPTNSLLYVSVDNQGEGFVPTDDGGRFAVTVDQLQNFYGDGDLVWGTGTWVCAINQDANQICQSFDWPEIIASYDMEGSSNVWGNVAIPGNTIYITVTHPVSGVIATGTTAPGTCDGCWNPTGYTLDLPDGTIAPDNTVTVDFGDGYVDSTDVVTITGNPDPDTDVVTGTAPANSEFHMNVDCQGGGCWSEANVQVDANGVYTVDFGTDGNPPHDIQYGDRFNAHHSDDHGHQTQYSFWLPAPNVRIDKQHSSGYARPGGVVVYPIEYRNEGNGTAENVQIVDTLPMSTTYAGDTSGVTPITGTGVITWNLGDLAPGDQGAFMVTLDVLSVSTGTAVITENCAVITTTTLGDYNLDDNSSCAGPVDIWDDEVDVDVRKWVNPDDPAPGQEFEYTINWCNNRGAAARSVWLTDTLPLSTTLASWSSEGDATYWTEVVTTGGQVVLYAPGLPGDACTELYLRLLLDADAQISTTLQNTVVITTAGDVDPDNNEDVNTSAHVSPPRYDMSVDKWFNNGQLVPGGELQYGVRYRNDGNSAVHAWLTDTLPAGTSFDSAWIWGVGTISPMSVTADYVVWDLGVVGVNEDVGFDFRLNISDIVTPGAVLNNCATVGITETEETPWDNESCVATAVYTAGQPNLFVSKRVEDYEPGWGNIRYRINFGNYGDQTVYNVHLTDTLPISTSIDWYNINWWGSQYTDTTPSGELQVLFERIEPGWSGQIELSVNLDDPDARFRWYTNTVEIDTPPDDSNPADNASTAVAFSGGEVEWVDLNVSGTNIRGCGYSAPVTVTTAGEERTYGGDCWDDDFDDPFQPGDVVTVAAGEGTHPVAIHIPDPFTANASSITDTVWGQIDALDHEQVNVDLDDGPNKNVQTDGSGNYSVTFSDVPRGGRGWVNYGTMINYAEVDFHHEFQSPDLILRVDYTEDGVDGNYEAGHTGWITVTESDGVTIKATCEITTAAWPWWGGSTGFSTHHHNWSPSQPDIEPDDWVYGEMDNGYTNTVHVGEIDGGVNVNTEVVSGTIHAPWLAPDLVDVRCEIHENNGPDSVYVPNVDPNGGSFYCDFSGEWDIEPGHHLAVNYTEPDGDRVETHPTNPAPYLRLNKNSTGEPGAGGNFGFQIQYWNNGGDDAENTVITDTLLYGMTYLTDTAPFTHTGSGQPGDPLVWHVGTLPANSSGQFAVMVEITATAGARITNTAQIATSNPYDQGDPWEKYGEWSGEVQDNDTHLNVGKGAWTGDPAPGYNFVYNVNVCNNGSTGSSEVTLTDTLHPSMTLQSWWGQHPGWTEVLSSSHQLVVSRPSIPGWWCSEVYLRVHLTDTAKAGDWISNTAAITASNDLDGDNNESTWEGWVSDPHTNLNINKHWNGGQLVPGGEIRYNIDYQNNGNVPVTSTIRITDTLPVSTTFVAAWDYDQFGNPSPVTPVFTGTEHVGWEIAGLDNGFGDNFEIVLNVDGHADPGTVLTNTVEISPQPGEDSYDDNTATVVETLYDHGPNLRVRKEGNWDDWGENTRRASYNLTVENIGDEPVAPVVITDTYDSKMNLDGDIGVNYWQWWDWGDDSANHTFTVTLESLQGGERMDINLGTITDTYPLPFGLVFTNTAEVTLDPDDTNADDNLDEVVLTTGPDLYVEKELVDGELRPGEQITFSLRFGNDHQGHEWWWNTQGDIWITDTLPSGFEFVTATRRSQGWAPYTPDYDNGTHIAWNTGSMPTGGEDELLVVMSITDTATGLDTFTNQVEIASTEPTSDTEPYYDNNSDSYDAPIALPAFEIGKVYESNRVAGMPVTYTLTVTNSGNEAGTGVVISDTIPDYLTEVITEAGTLQLPFVWWRLDSVEADGGTETVDFRATLPCTTGLNIVNDDYGVRSSDQGVSGPEGGPASFTVTAPSINVGLTRTLGAIVVSDTVHFTATSSTDGTGLSYTWDFGDGTPPTSGVLTASHAYTQDGDYTVAFTATDTCGHHQATTTTITVNAPNLTADFDHAPKPANILVNDTVYFTDTSTTNGPTITGWEWDFGDDSAHAFTQNTSHTYTTVGTYTVGLVVTDTLGYSNQEAKTDLVVVSSRCTELTSVTFTYAPSDPVIQSTVTFTAAYEPANATQPISYTWDFGDGETISGTEAVVTHTYALSDTYTVVVTATNCSGASAVPHAEEVAVTLIEGGQTPVDPGTGGTLVYTDTQGNPTTIEVPGGGVEDPITLLYEPILSPTQPISPNLRFADHAFDLAAYQGGVLQPGFSFLKPVTITIHYSDNDVKGIDESSLKLYYWDEDSSQWIDAAKTCTPPSVYDRHPADNWLAVPICHLSEWGIMGSPMKHIYLPLVTRNQ